MAERKKTRGPTRATLLKNAEKHETILAEKTKELEEITKQAQMLASVPPILFTISINRMTGRIAAIPVLEGSSIEDLRLLLKGVNIHQTQIIDLLADAAIAATEEEVVSEDDNEDVVNEEENDNEDVVNEEEVEAPPLPQG